MRAGYKIDNRTILKCDNCVLVYNYQDTNIVYNMPLSLNIINLWRDEKTIGIWKIKKLKDNERPNNIQRLR